MKLLVVGAGYVGLAYSTFFSSKYKVDLLEISSQKVDQIKKGISPINDEEVSKVLNKNLKNLSVTTKIKNYCEYSYIFLCLPTDYDDKSNNFDTSIIEREISKISKFNYKGIIVIKSTVPVGFTNKIANKYPALRIVFSPEFLREGTALTDIRNPSRVVGGGVKPHVEKYFELIRSCHNSKIQYFLVNFSEAEAIKLFSNTFLAMRVAFFNELDSYCMDKNLSSVDIIKGVCADERIGPFYNNPSFGYGGYCLPKDTKQLLKNYEDIPQSLISSIVKTNEIRKDFIANYINSKKYKTVGIFGLVMKKGSDNFRESSIISIIEKIKPVSNVVIYEPAIEESCFKDCAVLSNFEDFLNQSEIILANRYSDSLERVKNKVFTRDIFHED